MTCNVAVVSQKGGVGKTTTVVNVSVVLALRGHYVLVVDCDPQGDASAQLGVVAVSRATGSARPSTRGAALEPQRDILIRGLDVIPANPSSAVAQVERFTRAAVGTTNADGEYDFIIAACPPISAPTALAAMVACSRVLIPVQLAPGSLRALRGIITVIERFRAEEGVHIAPLGFLGTFYRENAGPNPKQALAALRKAMGRLVFDTVIHDSQAVAAAVTGRPIVLEKPLARGAREYEALTDEVLVPATLDAQTRRSPDERCRERRSQQSVLQGALGRGGRKAPPHLARSCRRTGAERRPG
jgi:chromosome partitioning protein